MSRLESMIELSVSVCINLFFIPPRPITILRRRCCYVVCFYCLSKIFRFASSRIFSVLRLELFNSYMFNLMNRKLFFRFVDIFVLFHLQSTMMPASVNVNRLATHQPNLEAGSVYTLTGFDVTRCNQNYRLSDSSLLIWFNDTISFKKITEPAVPIPL